MKEPDSNADICNWLLEQDPHFVLRWLNEIWEGVHSVPGGFNWVGLAEITPDMALPFSAPPDLDWARVAVQVNSFLIQEVKLYGRVYSSARIVPLQEREEACFRFEDRIIRLRVAFLLRLSHVAGDPVLDSSLLVQMFFDGLTFSREEALRQCDASSKTLSREQISKLRRIKRNLIALQPLVEQGLLPANQELLAWYSVRERLRW